MLTSYIKNKIYIVFLILIFSYLVFFFSSFLFQSGLVIYGFENEDIISIASETYIFQGKAEKIKKVLLNNNEILLNQEGKFTKKVYLFPAENIFIFETFSKNGKEKKRLIRIYRE